MQEPMIRFVFQDWHANAGDSKSRFVLLAYGLAAGFRLAVRNRGPALASNRFVWLRFLGSPLLSLVNINIGEAVISIVAWYLYMAAAAIASFVQFLTHLKPLMQITPGDKTTT